MVIWCQIYGKGPLRERERKPAAATWATLFNYLTNRITPTISFVVPAVEHWLE